MKSGYRNQNNKGCNDHLDVCMHCGSNILRGAMRCVSCGKVLKTPEEQSAAIRNMQKSQNRLRIGRILKLILFGILSGAAYYYSDVIAEFISAMLGK